MMIKKLTKVEITEGILLVWRVFNEFEAVNYPESGKKAFWDTIHDELYLDTLMAYGAYDEGKLIGVIAMRNKGSHLALFFVDGAYQRQGIGRKLFETCLKGEETANQITVHSSEYAVSVYKNLDFLKMVN
jgi:GNAT superfamily N-acetyltransferase